MCFGIISRDQIIHGADYFLLCARGIHDHACQQENTGYSHKVLFKGFNVGVLFLNSKGGFREEPAFLSTGLGYVKQSLFSDYRRNNSSRYFTNGQSSLSTSNSSLSTASRISSKYFSLISSQ